MSERIQRYEDFWPYYLQEHRLPATRLVHYVGTTLCVAFGVTALAIGRPALFWGMPLSGYGFAWFSHFFIERNRPATFKYPLWSLVSDFRLWGLWLSGRLSPHLLRAGVAPGASGTTQG